MRVPGIFVGMALLGLVGWRVLLAASPRTEEPATAAQVPGVAHAPGSPAAVSSSRATAPHPAADPAEAPAPSDAQEIKAQLLVAKARHTLGQAYERASSHGDFALAPGRILKSLLDRRCGLVQRHAEELAPYREKLRLGGSDSASLCRDLLFSLVKERRAVPEGVSQERLWEMLEQIDAAYERLVIADPSTGRDEAFRAAYERFREARRGIVGPELDRRLFGLADEVLHLPFQVEEWLRDPRTSAEQKLAAYEGTLQRIEREHGVRLASVVEPLELARHALRLQETAGPLAVDQQRAVMERYASPEVIQRYLEHQQEQQERSERLRAFNQERDQFLEQMAREGLTPEQRRQRMVELDSQLFEKYRLQ